jgi:CDP-glucose 4,6-dehydratase
MLLSEHLYNDGISKVGAYNFGPEEESMQKVKDVVDMILNHLKYGRYIIQLDETKHEATNLKLDSSRAKKILNWQSKYDLNRAVIETIEWYRQYHLEQSDIRKFTLKQINEYFKEM